MGEFDLVENIPELKPKVEEYLMLCLKKEVAAYSLSVKGTRCLLCPFRSFSRLRNLKAHLKHHCHKNMYLADVRSHQRFVVRADFDYSRAVTPAAPMQAEPMDLLQYSASKIRKWNSACTESTLALLQRVNRPVLVRVLTHNGPQYWVKALTVTCIRHSKELYYTSRFADLFLSMLLTNEGRISTSVDALYLHFGRVGRTPPFTSNLFGVLERYGAGYYVSHRIQGEGKRTEA